MKTPDTPILHAGDRAGFDRLFGPEVPKLRGVLRRLVGHPDDVDDLTQQTLLKAYQKAESFRGEARAGTWLCAIGTRLAIDHLRARRRWRERAQSIFAFEAQSNPETSELVQQRMGDPEFSFDVHQHIAYCFTCLGRTLDPEAQAALVLRDVLGFSNDEAAEVLGLTRSVLRHHLGDARKQMQTSFLGLCALVNKEGVCWQCSGLREASPKGKRGDPVPDPLPWRRRLEVVRDAPLGSGTTAAMHDLFFRRTEEQEQERKGDPNATSPCGRA